MLGKRLLVILRKINKLKNFEQRILNSFLYVSRYLYNNANFKTV